MAPVYLVLDMAQFCQNYDYKAGTFFVKRTTIIQGVGTSNTSQGLRGWGGGGLVLKLYLAEPTSKADAAFTGDHLEPRAQELRERKRGRGGEFHEFRLIKNKDDYCVVKNLLGACDLWPEGI